MKKVFLIMEGVRYEGTDPIKLEPTLAKAKTWIEKNPTNSDLYKVLELNLQTMEIKAVFTTEQ